MGQRMPIGLQLTGLVGSVIALMIVLLAVVLYEFKSTSADYQHLLSVTVKNSITLLEAEDDFHQGLSELRGYIITCNGYGERAQEGRRTHRCLCRQCGQRGGEGPR